MFDGDLVFIANWRAVDLFLHDALRAFALAQAIAEPAGVCEERRQILVQSPAVFALPGHCGFELPHAARLRHLPYGKYRHSERDCGHQNFREHIDHTQA